MIPIGPLKQAELITPREWKGLAWDAYINEPNYRLAASMVLALRNASTDDHKKIAMMGVASRFIERYGIQHA